MLLCCPAVFGRSIHPGSNPPACLHLMCTRVEALSGMPCTDSQRIKMSANLY